MEPQSVLSARVVNLLQLAEKLHGRTVKRNVGEDIQQLRYTTGKLYHLVCSQERSQKDMILKDPYNIQLLCRIFEARADKNVTENCLLLMQELLGRAQTSKRCSLLLNGGVPNVLLRLLVDEARDKEGLANVVIILQILAKLGPKDRKFSVKARLNGALLVTVNLIKNHMNNSRLMHSVLSVLKIYSANSVNASYLGKHGIVMYLFKVLEVCGRRSVKPLKLILESLSNLTKLKNNSARVISQGGVQILLPMYQEWMQSDTRNRQIDLRKSILIVLKNITNIDAGRKAFVEHNGIRILYESAQEGVDCKEVESMIILASVIMRRCCPQDTLPVESIDSPVLYRLPRSDFHKPQSLAATYDHSSCGLDTSSLPHIKHTSFISKTDDSASIEDDDNIDSDEDQGKNDNSEDDDDGRDAESPPYTRTLQELRTSYEIFFPEMFDICPYESETNTSDDNHETTASYDILSDKSFSCNPIKCEPIPLLTDNRSSNRNDSLKSDTTFTSSYNDSSSSRYASPRLDSSRSDPNSLSHFLLLPQKVFEFPHLGEVKPDIFYPIPRALNTLRLTGQSHDLSFLDVNRSPVVNLKKGKQQKSQRQTTSRRSRRSQIESALNSEFQGSLTISGLCQTAGIHDSPDSSDSPEMDAMLDLTNSLRDPNTYSTKSLLTKSVQRFTKLAHPDYSGVISHLTQEPLYHRKLGVQRAKIFEDIQRMIEPEKIYNRVVYDLDSLVTRVPRKASNNPLLTNNDSDRVGEPIVRLGILSFNSQFECGNLRKAIQVRDVEYDLVITPDVNTDHHHQWFYFEVSNMVANVNYRFNIVNCEKVNSQFNFGMRPVMYSVIESLQGRPFWNRTGGDICYYKNHFTRSSATAESNSKGYYTTTFSVLFPHSRDVCYLAYHYPYTYTTLLTQIANWEKQVNKCQIFFRHQTLCTTLAGNSVSLLTITAQPEKHDERSIAELKSRPYIFLSGRVHPGESNSSWVMKGSIDFLLSDQPAAQIAREMYIFKIVPMLNPDGVINGNHRCSLTGEDLNRRWLYPCPSLHPTIYHTKGLLMFMSQINITPFVYCDYHGHSRRKNVFLYGCAASQSWCNDDKNPPGSKSEDCYKTLPKLLQQIAPSFSLTNCSFTVEKVKEATARVVVWREIGVARSYTMESTYCGCDQGPYKDYHITIQELKEMGQKFCEALTKLEPKLDSPESTRETIYMPSEYVNQMAAATGKSDDVQSMMNYDTNNECFLKDDASDFEEVDKEGYDDYDFDDDNSDENCDDSETSCLFLTEGGF